MPIQKSLYAALIDLTGEHVLVVGGGKVAARKVASLLDAGAQVTVVSPKYAPEFAALGHRCNLVRREFKTMDLKRQKLVFAVTDDVELNTEIANTAKRRELLVNVAAPAEAGNMFVPAKFKRGRLQVSISSGGASAAVSKTIRRRLERALGTEWGTLIELLEARRTRLKSEITDPTERRRLFRALGSSKWARMIRDEGAAKTEEAIEKTIAKAKAVKR